MVFWGRKNVSVGRAGIDPLTVRYINFSVWSRRLLANVSKVGEHGCDRSWVSRAVVSSDEASLYIPQLINLDIDRGIIQ